jgi:hypothetical protein
LRHVATIAAMAAMLMFAAAAALAQSESGQATVCHKPGTPAEHTLTVDESALEAHLDHGDTEGACPGQAAGQYADIGGEAGASAVAEQHSESSAAGSQGSVQSSADLQYGGTSAEIQNNTQVNQTVSAEGDVNQNFFFAGSRERG